ncbi:MAG: (d)CMP kinase, partial [Pseudomonadota bacterium]
MIIAIDGPAASGKGTLARRVAAHYGLRYLDTGALYRAVARDVLAEEGDLRDPKTATRVASDLDPETLDDPFLRDRGVGEAASIVARIPEVRDAILAYQRDFGTAAPGAVIDGRDIGTVVCPDARAKLFVTASLEERARRRYHELRSKAYDVTRDAVTDEIRNRDRRDLERTVAPLAKA